MKVYANVLALCVFHSSVWGTAAFSPKVSKKALSTSSFSDAGTISGGVQSPPPGVEPPAPDMVPQSTRESSQMGSARNIWETSKSTTVQGGSLRTWSFPSPNVDSVQVSLKTDGRPLNANVELWQGPDNTPQKMGVYIEDGSVRPFNVVIETPRGTNAIAVRNTGHIEFPLSAIVEANTEGQTVSGVSPLTERISQAGPPRVIQGGALRTYPFGPEVESVQMLLKTDGRPLNARVELLQGPNNNKQVIELYTEDGLERPFCAVIETPGVGNVVRIVNTATMEYPLYSIVEPFDVQAGGSFNQGMYTGGVSGSTNFNVGNQW